MKWFVIGVLLIWAESCSSLTVDEIRDLIVETTKQQNADLIARIESVEAKLDEIIIDREQVDAIESQLNHTLQLIDERFVDQLDKDELDSVHRYHVTRQVDAMELAIVATENRLDVLDLEQTFLTYDQQLHDIEKRLEQIANQTDSNDVLDQMVTDTSTLLERKIQANQAKLNEQAEQLNEVNSSITNMAQWRRVKLEPIVAFVAKTPLEEI